MHQCTNPSNEVTNNKTGITKYRTPRETKGFGIQCSGLEWVTYEATYVCALCSLAECVTQLEGSETAVVGMSEWGDEGLGCRPTRQRRKTLQERGWGRGGEALARQIFLGSYILFAWCTWRLHIRADLSEYCHFLIGWTVWGKELVGPYWISAVCQPDMQHSIYD